MAAKPNDRGPAGRRIAAADIEAIEEMERRSGPTPIGDLSLAVIALRNGFTEDDVRSILGYMPDINLPLDALTPSDPAR